MPEKNETEKKRFDIKRTAKGVGRAAAGAGLAASVFFGSMFASPQEIVKPEDVTAPTAIVQQAAPIEAPAVYAEAADAVDEKRSLRERIRAWLMRQPIGVRLLLLLPVWAIFCGAIWGVAALTGVIQIPLLGVLIKGLIGAVAAFGLVLAAQKAIFPDMPLKELLSKRNLTGLIITAAVIAIGASVGGLLRKDLPWLSAAIVGAAGLLYVLFFLLFVKKSEKKEQS